MKRLLFVLLFSGAVQTHAAGVAIRPFAEQPRWVCPREYGGYLASFDVILEETPLLAEFRLTVKVDYAPVSGIGMVRVEKRTNGAQMLPLFAFLPLSVQTNASEGRLSIGTGHIPDVGYTSLIVGTNQVAIFSKHVPEAPAGGKITTTLAITAELQSGIVRGESTIEVSVRRLYPVLRLARISPEKFKLFSEGGLPFQPYEIAESNDLVRWEWFLRYNNIIGDTSIQVPAGKQKAFYRVMPIMPVTAADPFSVFPKPIPLR